MLVEVARIEYLAAGLCLSHFPEGCVSSYTHTYTPTGRAGDMRTQAMINSQGIGVFRRIEQETFLCRKQWLMRRPGQCRDNGGIDLKDALLSGWCARKSSRSNRSFGVS